MQAEVRFDILNSHFYIMPQVVTSSCGTRDSSINLKNRGKSPSPTDLAGLHLPQTPTQAVPSNSIAVSTSDRTHPESPSVVAALDPYYGGGIATPMGWVKDSQNNHLQRQYAKYFFSYGEFPLPDCFHCLRAQGSTDRASSCVEVSIRDNLEFTPVGTEGEF
jgi:hypothetical protein